MTGKPLRIGVTGGIGSGKTVICRIFNLLGVPIYDADERARSLMNNDQEVIRTIINHFGEKAYMANGTINRDFLAGLVFNDPEKLEIINGIVHPAVARDFDRWCESNNNFPYIIKEAALLVESGSYQYLDFLVTVTAPKELRLARVLDRDHHRSKEQVLQIMDNQLDDETKISKSYFTIANDDRALVIPQVIKIHQFFNNYVHTG